MITWTVRAPVISRAHPLFSSPCATVLVLQACGHTAFRRAGAKSAIERPSIHLSVRKNDRQPFPISTVTEAAKRVLTGLSEFTGKHDQGLLGSVRFSQSQRILSGYPCKVRSGSPRPPRSAGLQTFGQANKQCPPETESEPFHRKARRHLLNSENVGFRKL
jgi:hypothetical protein